MMCHPVLCTFYIRNVFRLCIFPIFIPIYDMVETLEYYKTCYCIFTCSLNLKIISNYVHYEMHSKLEEESFKHVILLLFCNWDYTCSALWKYISLHTTLKDLCNEIRKHCSMVFYLFSEREKHYLVSIVRFHFNDREEII